MYDRILVHILHLCMSPIWRFDLGFELTYFVYFLCFLVNLEIWFVRVHVILVNVSLLGNTTAVVVMREGLLEHSLHNLKRLPICVPMDSWRNGFINNVEDTKQGKVMKQLVIYKNNWNSYKIRVCGEKKYDQARWGYKKRKKTFLITNRWVA